MDRKRAAFAGCAFNGYHAAVGLDDVADNGKTQSGIFQLPPSFKHLPTEHIKYSF